MSAGDRELELQGGELLGAGYHEGDPLAAVDVAPLGPPKGTI